MADDDTWLVGDELGVARWGWDRRRHWAQDTGPVRGLAWAAGQAWVLSDANVLPFAADGTPLPPREAPLVRGIQADWARRAVLLGGAVEQAVLRPDELRPVPGPGSDGRMTRGADGWLIPEEAGGWSRVALDGTRTATDAPRDAYWYGESPDGRHRAWIDSAGVAWIDGAPVVSSGERRLWVEWVAEDRWLVTSRIDTAIVDHRGTTLLRRELVRGRLLDLAAAGDHLLVFGPDQRVEAWDLGALSTTADAILTTLGRDLGVEVVGSEVRLLGA